MRQVSRYGVWASLVILSVIRTTTPAMAVQFGRCDVRVGSALASITSAGVDDAGRPVLLVMQSSSNSRVLRLTIDPPSLVGACDRGVGIETLAIGAFIPQALLAGDLNDDRRIDLVLAGGDGTSGHDLAVLNGIGSAQFSGEVTFRAARDGSNALAIADIDRDGASDLVVGSGADSSVTILYSGSVKTDPLSVQGISAGNLGVGFLNSDGRPDIVVGSSASGRLTGLFQDSTRTFRISSSSASVATRNLALVDLDGDLISDLLLTRNNAASLDAYFGPADSLDALGTPGLTLATGAGPIAVTVGDITGDGELDVAVANNDENSVSLFVGDGLGGLAESSLQAGCRATSVSQRCSVGSRPTDLLAADESGGPLDLDGDGIGDVVVANADGTLTFLLSNPAAANSTPIPTSTPITPGPTATPTPSVTSTPDGRCCDAHSNPRCTDPTPAAQVSCEKCVCDNDQRCCDVEWDDICVGFARSQLCEDLCACAEFTATPTISPTFTPTLSPNPTHTPLPTDPPTATSTPSPTREGTPPPATRTPTATASVTGTLPTATRTFTLTPTVTLTPTITMTPTVQACVGTLCINGSSCSMTPLDRSGTWLWMSLMPALLMIVRRFS